MNQLAFPGVGTIMAGRRVGYAQATLMVAGFGLMMGFMVWFFICVARYATTVWTEEEYRAAYGRWLWALWSGGGLCVVAWCWSLISSIAILRGAEPPPGSAPMGRG